ncbi:alpha/beta fold hydrolase [Nocardioides lianchengensis]|uniref:Pimeloyl-ACP methyl ester carboxylesterase n=1 Tax=Nocardioides lianchengensis TaxID=1045774 RepID=A0A1G6V506_9ACTN|nr:alpha/beta fold hydrolase [Nocardioides lianchengensis]NYG11139.1 pimeloyl-ACP methyl ester carboxylesterase [Nocardioides lianchengensis]SDD48618.1 Pimeloyl-ACP methyl ester carboxylesterase [Nocardioides lianchengensis]
MTSAPEVLVSPELFAPVGDGVELCYQTFGDPDDEPLLLVMGLGGPMTWWDPELCRMLAGRGFFVIRYDNRDTGRSSRMTGRVGRATLVRAFTGAKVRAPYSIADLARDAVGLLDHLGLDSAHVVGVSMGGMIAQTVALDAPSRVRSLTSIMSTTGKRSVGWQHPSLLPTLLGGRGDSREEYVAGSVVMARLIGSPAYPEPEEGARLRGEETFDRGINPAGVLRQMVAVLTQPNRGQRLRGIRVPTLVVHGLADKMVHVSGGRATAAAVPGSELLLVDGMGHDLPVELFETFTAVIRRNADRA